MGCLPGSRMQKRQNCLISDNDDVNEFDEMKVYTVQSFQFTTMGSPSSSNLPVETAVVRFIIDIL